MSEILGRVRGLWGEETRGLSVCVCVRNLRHRSLIHEGPSLHSLCLHSAVGPESTAPSPEWIGTGLRPSSTDIPLLIITDVSGIHSRTAVC